MEKIARTYANVLLRSTAISCLDALRVSTCNKTIHVTYIKHFKPTPLDVGCSRIIIYNAELK